MRLRQIKPLMTLILVVVLSLTVFAQQPGANGSSVERIRQVITYLASDALEGRRTGTPGANDAARYIAGEFNRLGLRPGMQLTEPARTRGENQSAYQQSFPYVSQAELGRANSLTKWFSSDSAVSYRVKEDWMPLGVSSDGR